MQIFKDPKYNFTSKMKFAAVLSILVIASGVVSLIAQSLNWGIDFIGGTMIQARFTELPPIGEVRDRLEAAGQSNAVIQQLGQNNDIMIRVEKSEESEEAVAKAIRKSLYTQVEKDYLKQDRFDMNSIGENPLYGRLEADDPLSLGSTENARRTYRDVAKQILDFRKNTDKPIKDADTLASLFTGKLDNWGGLKTYLSEKGFFGGFKVLSQASVGPSVGRELREKAYLAVGLSLFGILVYISFRFQFVYGLAAIAALFHDVLITVGIFSFTQRSFTLNIVAALLIIVGYSLNDTIVVFDRIRDNLRLLRREKFSVIINRSINQTLGRTVLTSGTTLLVVGSLYVLGGTVINGFAFALLIGVMVGTYSSIFIASAILVLWNHIKESRDPAAQK